jgi:hypothetical protein
MNPFALFTTLAGLIIGLGALTVIDFHGFLAQKSEYWTEATTRTHKVTKPLIWTGLFLFMIGAGFLFKNDYSGIPTWMGLILIPLVLNGCFLSFAVSPHLLKKEKEGRAKEILSPAWQRAIFASFILSLVGWWALVVLLTLALAKGN